MTTVMDFRDTIIQSLNKRNFLEGKDGGYKTIVDSYQLLNDRVFVLNVENNRLNTELARLIQEKGISLNQSASENNLSKNYNLEQKVYQLQEEITNLYREKSSLSSQVLDVNKILQDKDRTIQQKTLKITELEGNLLDYQNQLKASHDKIREMDCTIQTMRDEIHANSLFIHSLEQKNRELHDNYNEILLKFRKVSDELMEAKNVEHDTAYKLRQMKIQEDLAEAANLQLPLEEKDLPTLPSFAFCASVTIPTKIFKRVEAHDSDVNCVRWAPSGKLLATGSTDRRLKLWSFIQGNVETRSILIGCNQGITSVDFDPEETLVLAGSSDYACRVWSCTDGRLRQTLTGHSNKVLCARFMGNSGRVVTGSGDRTLRLWDLRNQGCYKTFLSQSACHDIVCAYSMNVIVSGHFDKKLRVWDARKDMNADQITLPGRITGLDIIQDSYLVLAATRDDSLHVWDLRMAKIVQCLKHEGARVTNDHSRPCFSPDGQFACLGSADGCLYIWNVHTGRLVSIVKGDGNGIVCVHWNPNGSSVISCDKLKTFSLWTD